MEVMSSASELTKNTTKVNTITTSAPKIISCDDMPSSPSSPTSTSNPKLPNPLADELLARCLKVSDEINLLEKKLLQRLPPKQRSKRGNLPIELRHFKNAIMVEQRLLESLSYTPPTPQTQHSLRSSNLKFLESVWAVAKTCSGLQVIFRTVQLFDHPTDNAARLRGNEKKKLKRKKTPVQVDIIAQNGLEWIKVANLSERRLETEFAKARWEAEGFRDEDENGDGSDGGRGIEQTILEFQHDSDAFSLVKSARSMVLAAQQTRVQYLHPEITIVLPNINYDPQDPQPGSPVHTLITAILSTGARVQTSNNSIISPTPIPGDGSALTDNFGNTITNRSAPLNLNPPESAAEAALTTLSITSDPINLITPRILIDCTILLALVSDLSHEPVAEQPIFHRYILQQVRSEKEEPLLPNWIYPSIQGKEMVCTFDAYKRFKEIVEIVGSENEKSRAEALVWGGAGRDWRHPSPSKSGSSNNDAGITFTEDGEPLLPDGRTRTSLLSTLRSLSKHPVPENLNLPITVVDSLESRLMSHNPVAAKIGQELSAVNRSSMFTAWEMGVTIVTTNGSVVKRLEWLVEENRVRDDDVGPKVHLLAIARSLVGKMKKGAEILVEG
ncbi:uncharacterized protein DFL_008600 [Arthrobotrys flagrans]|uniref:DUF1308 domain-containing protein n=1 Tax=Arthrobotrys flagrans TaxID=97331 RepID=A0A436ZPC5_ARTFL|nr:hypothetical protein DFL_008600 [Arthrobotrys flagrans]